MSDIATLHDSDIVTWSERQADALRRRAGNEIDWDNVANEIEEVGMGALERVEGLLYQALAHRLKILCWPQARDVQKWQHDYLNFLGQARLHHRVAWDRRIDVDGIYQTARRHLPTTMYGATPVQIPSTCPWTIDQLLHDDAAP
jgi:hypothetical protein